MAQKRMFDKYITNSDKFLEMPDSSQNLYFHLSMNADDDGFVDNWKSIMRMTGHKEDDMKVLILKSFVIPFESGVIVIKHWRINNYLRNDRHKPTKYQDELNQLVVEKNDEYSLGSTAGIPMVNIDKNRIEENSIIKENIKRKKVFVKPTIKEIDDYCRERKNNVRPEQFYDFYESKGWVVGKSPMKDWKAAVRTWEKSRNPNRNASPIPDWLNKDYSEKDDRKLSDEDYEFIRQIKERDRQQKATKDNNV